MQTTEYIKSEKKQLEGQKGFFNYRIGQSYKDVHINNRITEKGKYFIAPLAGHKKSSLLQYNFKNIYIGEFSFELSYLIDSIEKSKSILLLEENFDDNGSEQYSFETWTAAIKFLLDYANTLYVDYNIKIDKPKIYNGPSGSIDILWENKKYTILINVHKNGVDASFYAENTLDTLNIRGEFKLNSYIKALLPFAIKL